MKTPVIALFDLDGVLIHPGGYRAAVQKTTSYFLEQMKLNHLTPNNNDQEAFESIGITNEWDMIPLFIAIVFERALEFISVTDQWRDISQAIQEISLQNNKIPQIEYQETILKFKPLLIPGISPAEAIYRASTDGHRPDLFPRLSSHPVMHSLLTNTSSVNHNLTTKIHQCYVLGNALFSQTYGLPAPIASESTLLEYDRAALDRISSDQILSLVNNGNLYASIYTARPSLPPHSLSDHTIGYPPEADLAARLVGLEEIPLIGYGRLLYLADKRNIHVVRLVKPQPTQALAAIAAAWSGNEWAALQWAWEICHQNKLTNGLNIPPEIEIHIFEDSLIGIEAGISAVAYLKKIGIHPHLHTWGIAENPQKIAGLQSAGARVVKNINIAIQQAL